MHRLFPLLKRILSIISYLIPRDQKVWVFVGWHRKKTGELFADNAKHFLLHVHNNHPEITAVWIAADHATAKYLRHRGIISYSEKSLLGIWYQLRASNFIIDAFLQEYTSLFSRGAKIVQLLHGKGLKKKGYAQTPLQENTFIFGTSPFTNSLLPKEFTGGAQMHATGYSRNDQFFDESKAFLSDEEHHLITVLQNHRNAGKKIVMYAPTFRRGQEQFTTQDHFDESVADTFAKEHNAIFLTSLHTKYRERKTLSEHGSIIELPECDINSIMPSIDILITDYSSSYVDYVLLDRPIIFYVYDLEEYHTHEGLIENYEAHMPGAKIKNQDDLFTEISQLLAGQDTWTGTRKTVRDLYHTHQDGTSSERIMKILLGKTSSK